MIDEKSFRDTLHELLHDPELLKMKQYYQHGGNTYAHSVNVARTSMRIAKRLPFHVKGKDLARGAMLHDFYLYGTDDMPYTAYQHGTGHPKTAYENAARIFNLSDTEKDIILTHMWPLTPMAVPHCRESVVVTVADKYCATKEFGIHFSRVIRSRLHFA